MPSFWLGIFYFSKVNNIMENRKYAKLLDGNTLEYAPKMFKENSSVIVPKQDDDNFFFSRGYYKVIDNKPAYDLATQYAEILKWNIDETFHTLTSVYVVREIENANIQSNHVKRYSKLKITLFCIEMGIWNSVKEYLEKIGYYDLFVMATFFLESDEYFNKGLQMYMEAMVASGSSKNDIESLIENMKNFAYDGDVTVNEEGRAIGLY